MAPLLLLVDDMAEIALIVQRLARPLGYQVLHCRRAEEAWEQLRQVRPDLLILDLNLPGMSGRELCRRLRQDPPLAGLRVAYLSSGPELEALAAEPDRGGADYLLSKDLLARPEAWQGRLQEILGDGDANCRR
jgi:CheY-like chemotaxis protein